MTKRMPLAMTCRATAFAFAESALSSAAKTATLRPSHSPPRAFSWFTARRTPRSWSTPFAACAPLCGPSTAIRSGAFELEPAAGTTSASETQPASESSALPTSSVRRRCALKPLMPLPAADPNRRDSDLQIPRRAWRNAVRCRRSAGRSRGKDAGSAHIEEIWVRPRTPHRGDQRPSCGSTGVSPSPPTTKRELSPSRRARPGLP